MLHEEEPQRDDYLARVTGKASRQASMRSTRTATVERAGLICVKRGPIRDIQRRSPRQACPRRKPRLHVQRKPGGGLVEYPSSRSAWLSEFVVDRTSHLNDCFRDDLLVHVCRRWGPGMPHQPLGRLDVALILTQVAMVRRII